MHTCRRFWHYLTSLEVSQRRYIIFTKLLSNVQALETLGKLREISRYVRMTIDKLEGIRGDLVRTDDDWQE